MNTMMGFILTGGENVNMKELLLKRSIASIPIGGKYRLIDFVMSNMVNSKIHNVAITTQFQFRSLMDHLGSGKEWDLDRKRGGLFIFPPFLSKDSSLWYTGTADAIYRNLIYIERSTQDYVVIAPDDSVYKLNFQDVVSAHIETKADITVVYKEVHDDNLQLLGIVELDEYERIIGFEQYPENPKTNNASMGIYVMKRELLLQMMYEYRTPETIDFVNDILVRNLQDFHIHGYRFQGYWRPINTIQAYYNCNMEMKSPEIGIRLFRSSGPLYTKIKDYHPAYIGKDSDVLNSIVPEGCNILGNVYNSVLFRGVAVKQGARVMDSIILQDAVIGENCVIENAIIDKNYVVPDKTSVIGSKENPAIVQRL